MESRPGPEASQRHRARGVGIPSPINRLEASTDALRHSFKCCVCIAAEEEGFPFLLFVYVSISIELRIV
jgi:hypothetical protein